MASEGNDYGVGSGYWKASSETMSSSKTASSTQFPSQRAISRQRSVTVDFSEEKEPELDPMSKPEPEPMPVKKRTRRTPAPEPAPSQRRLFLESDDEDDNAQVLGDSDPEAVSLPTKPASQVKKRRAPVDDDSDDGVTFKGFGTKRRKAAR